MSRDDFWFLPWTYQGTRIVKKESIATIDQSGSVMITMALEKGNKTPPGIK